MKYVNEVIKNLFSQFTEFIKFLFEKNIFQTGLAFIIAAQINQLFKDFLASIVTPVADKVTSAETKNKKVKLFGVEFLTGQFILSLINFMIVMIFLFYLYKLSNSSSTIFQKITSKFKFW